MRCSPPIGMRQEGVADLRCSEHARPWRGLSAYNGHHVKGCGFVGDALHEHAVGLRVLRQLPLDTLGEYSTTTRHPSLADASSNKVDIDCTGGLGFGNAGFDVPCLT